MGNPLEFVDASQNPDDFSLSSPSAGEHEEEVLASVLKMIQEKNQTRFIRHGNQPFRPCITIKLPVHEVAKLKQLTTRWKLPYTDLIRFLLRATLPLLDSPTEQIRPMLEEHRAAEAARLAGAKMSKNKDLADSAALAS